MTPKEFAQKVKTKYPEYADIGDVELSRKIVTKYPEYASSVDFESAADSSFEVEQRSVPVSGQAFTHPPRPLTPEQLQTELAASPLSFIPSGKETFPALAGMGGGMVGGVPGAAVFGAAARSLQRAYRAYQDPQEEVRPGELLYDVGKTAGAQAISEKLSRVGGAILGKAAAHVPTVVRQVTGIAEPVTEYVRQRGARNILTQANASTDLTQELLERAQEALTGVRRAAGIGVEAAEDALISSRAGQKLFDTSKLAASLRDKMTRLGYIGPMSNLARSGEAAELKQILDSLDYGMASGHELIQLRRFLDDKVKFVSGAVRPVGGQTERLIKGAASEIRDTIDNAYPGLKAANANFSKAADLYRKYRKPLGGQSAPEGDLFSDEKALQKMRLALERGGTTRDKLLEFDTYVNKGEALMQRLMDNLAAREFAGSSPRQLSPSGHVLRGLAVLGATAPRTAGFMLRAGEYLHPAGTTFVKLSSLGARTAAQTLADYYRSPGAP